MTERELADDLTALAIKGAVELRRDGAFDIRVDPEPERRVAVATETTAPPDRLPVVLAHALLRIKAARDYGLITGGPDIDVDRCDEYVALGREHDIVPTEDEIQSAAVELLAEINADG